MVVPPGYVGVYANEKKVVISKDLFNPNNKYILYGKPDRP
jgi:hypothetical protein